MSGSSVSQQCSVTAFHQVTITSPEDCHLFFAIILTNRSASINVKIHIRVIDVQFSGLPQSVMTSPK